jgi:hypothetical protein
MPLEGDWQLPELARSVALSVYGGLTRGCSRFAPLALRKRLNRTVMRHTRGTRDCENVRIHRYQS